MAQEDEHEVSTSNSSQITFIELQDTFEEIWLSSKRWGSKIVFLKKWFPYFKKKVNKNSFSKDFSKEKQMLNEKVKIGNNSI